MTIKRFKKILKKVCAVGSVKKINKKNNNESNNEKNNEINKKNNIKLNRKNKAIKIVNEAKNRDEDINVKCVYYREAPLRRIFSAPAKLPLLREAFVKMVVVVIEKGC